MSKELQWGETPFDEMDREQLLRLTQKMYTTLVSLGSVTQLCRAGEESSFWGPRGSGGRALEMLDQTLKPIHSEYSTENIYRAFFRYATDLLFTNPPGFEIGFGWAVCPACGNMFGRKADGHSGVGEPCYFHLSSTEKCSGILRSLEWSDLEKQGRN